jgi:hypothetical protein
MSLRELETRMSLGSRLNIAEDRFQPLQFDICPWTLVLTREARTLKRDLFH